MTSANVTFYTVFNKNSRNVVGEHRQNCMCKNTIKDELDEYQPPEQYLIRLIHPDEDEVTDFSKLVNLKDFLDGKYKHTLWRENDGHDVDTPVDDSHYCEKHGYDHLKTNCPECLREDYERLKAENKTLKVKQMIPKTLEDLLETWAVLAPRQWMNNEGPADWFAVCNDEGIVAYFADEKAAFRFRMAEINRALNG